MGVSMTYVGQTVRHERVAQVVYHAQTQWLLASDHREATSKVLCHQVGGLAHACLVRLDSKVLENEVARRYACYRDRALHDRVNNLKSTVRQVTRGDVYIFTSRIAWVTAWRTQRLAAGWLE